MNPDMVGIGNPIQLTEPLSWKKGCPFFPDRQQVQALIACKISIQ
jgi:hypothetical protein